MRLHLRHAGHLVQEAGELFGLNELILELFFFGNIPEHDAQLILG